MVRYLLDTNAFFEIICYLGGKNVRSDTYDYADVIRGECYISKITELEIYSVIGKYRRGEQNQWQCCKRMLSEDGENICSQKYFYKGIRPWSNKLIRDYLKLVKEVLEGRNPNLKVQVLDITEATMNEAKKFILYSFRHKFGSHDAIIAVTAKMHSDDKNQCHVVTSDKGLIAAMKRDEIQYLVPGKNAI